MSHQNWPFDKFADDTYLVIPAAKVNTRTAEINNIEAWAAENNLRLNKACLLYTSDAADE